MSDREADLKRAFLDANALTGPYQRIRMRTGDSGIDWENLAAAFLELYEKEKDKQP